MTVLAQSATTNENSQKSSWAVWYIAVAVLSGVGVLGKASLLEHFFHLPVPALMTVAGVYLTLPFFWRYAVRARVWLAPVGIVLLAAVFLFFYPRVIDLHAQGRGSDQSDCIVAAAGRMLAHQWPYQPALLSSRNALSCGPGWVALQAPTVGLLGYKWTLVIFWLLSMAAIVRAVGWNRARAFFSLMVLSLGLWISAANGSDFLTFGLVLTALVVTLRSGQDRAPLQLGAAALLVGLLAQFRVPTLLIPALLTKRIGKVGAILAWVFATLCQAAFLLWNPHGFIVDGPLHVISKLMRMRVMSSHPQIAAFEFVACSAVAFALLLIFGERNRARPLLFFYLFAIFTVPALQNLFLKIRDLHNVVTALEYWEGGVWIAACLPLAAMALVQDVFSTSQLDSASVLEEAGATATT